MDDKKLSYTAAHQYEQMTDEDWDNVDKQHRQIAEKFFTQLGATDIAFSTGNNSIDMTFKLFGRRCSCELKDREQAALRFKDVMIEKIKYSSIHRRAATGEFDKAYAMNHYPDGTIRLASIFSTHFSEHKLRCPKTSYVKGCTPEYVWKDCVLLQKFVEFKTVAGKFEKTQ